MAARATAAGTLRTPGRNGRGAGGPAGAAPPGADRRGRIAQFRWPPAAARTSVRPPGRDRLGRIGPLCRPAGNSSRKHGGCRHARSRRVRPYSAGPGRVRGCPDRRATGSDRRRVADLRRRPRQHQVLAARPDRRRERQAAAAGLALGLARQRDRAHASRGPADAAVGVQGDADPGRRRALHQDVDEPGRGHRRRDRRDALGVRPRHVGGRPARQHRLQLARRRLLVGRRRTRASSCRPATRTSTRSTPPPAGRSPTSAPTGPSTPPRACAGPSRGASTS